MNSRVSVVIPTYNSEKTLERTLLSIKKQKYPANLIEILVVDGGSRDRTKDIAKKSGSRLLNNLQKQQEYAKTIGIKKSTGDYIMFLDSDEELVSTAALKKSVDALRKYNLKIVLQTGYKKPNRASSINDYINFFSDPFAHFIYGTTSDSKDKIRSWEDKYKTYKKMDKLIIFNFLKNKQLPLVDMAAGTVINKKLVFNNFSKSTFEDKLLITKLFYLVNKIDGRIGILKNSPILHYSADSYFTFLKKIWWRVRVNVHYKNIPGTGFSNREEFQPKLLRYKKYLFMLYVLTLILPVYESVYYAIKYKKFSLLLHFPLTVYTFFVIICEYFLLVVGVKPKLSIYGKN